jgi:hypothetical protein
VEEGEEADHRFVGAGFFAEFETGSLDSLPVVRAVNRIFAQRED